jgi:hypothetical protein
MPVIRAVTWTSWSTMRWAEYSTGPEGVPAAGKPPETSRSPARIASLTTSWMSVGAKCYL